VQSCQDAGSNDSGNSRDTGIDDTTIESDAGWADSAGHDTSATDGAQVDTGVEPANCVDEAEVDLGALERKQSRSGWMVLRERFRHDTTRLEALVQATFRDYSQYNGTPGQEVAINSHCVGYVGEPTPSDRHCEYTETPCDGDGDCEAGVSCRDFDRLSVNGVRFDGVVGYDDGLDLDRVERGFYEKTGLTELFSSTAINLRTGGVSDPTQHGFYEYSGIYFDIDTPVEIRVQTPALDGSRSLSQGEVAFKWNAASGDIDGVQIMVGIDVRADQKKVGSSQTRPLHLKCVATDDACLVLRQEAIDFLLQSDAEWEQADEFSVSVRRVKIYDEVWGLPSDTEYVFDMSYEVVGTLAP